MKILLASSEVHPYSKTGGLADMVGALGRALAQMGHRVGIVTPLYQGVRERLRDLKPAELSLDFPLGLQRVRGELWSLETAPGLTLYFIDQPDFFQRAGLYQREGVDYEDNAERFLFFSKAVAHLAHHLAWKPELLHLHDWQTAFAALLLAHQRQIPGWESGPRSCLTIHNLAYQGTFPAAKFALANLPWSYFTPASVEFYGRMNCLKAGLTSSDMLTTVSPRYAREITSEEYGCGLEGLLRLQGDRLVGILNGADYDEWNTTTNPFLKAPFSALDLDGKTVDKLELQQEFGLAPNPSVPLFGSIGRMVEQKGVDIMLHALEEMLAADLNVVVLGSGALQFEQAFLNLARRFPTKIAVRIGFDQGLSHRVEAGSDFFLMPSRFEPCGLNQMYSLRYGALPIVRVTGGLDDTVVDVRDDAARANGIKFEQYSGSALAKAMHKALALFAAPEALAHFRKNAMAADFSWERTAGEYLRVYQKALSAGASANSAKKVL